MEKLVELAKPISKWLKENCNPHCAVIITDGHVKVVADEFAAPLSDSSVGVDFIEAVEGGA